MTLKIASGKKKGLHKHTPARIILDSSKQFTILRIMNFFLIVQGSPQKKPSVLCFSHKKKPYKKSRRETKISNFGQFSIFP